MWMASAIVGSRIFAIGTIPKSKKSRPVAAITFAKSRAVTMNMGTMQIKGLSLEDTADHNAVGKHVEIAVVPLA
jgi:hypothetical protein